ncbi:MAG: hypothetical protein HQL68_13205 [Magnetococcales bacterium]|nr:hypothetical protein [Magnetococcales bacterium]
MASVDQVRLELALLSHLFTVAIKEWHSGLPYNPVQSIRKPTKGKARIRRFEGDEEERLLAACKENSNPILHWVVIIAFETGMRKSEILTIERNQVDL